MVLQKRNEIEGKKEVEITQVNLTIYQSGAQRDSKK